MNVEPIDAALVETDVGRQSVSEHVREHLNVSATVRRLDRLGDNVEAADDDMDAHLKSVFDHRVGSLPSKQRSIGPAPSPNDSTSALDAPAAPAPIDFAALLGDGQNVRKAIVMSEILQRPEQRW
jgi:hypothetical protein